MWILNNFFKDLAFILTPGLWSLFLILLFPQGNFLHNIIIVLLLTIDSSHIYSTFWRTIFDKKEFKRSPFLYKVSPLIIGIILFLWFFLKIPYFWNFIIYLTVFHQIRQAIGLQKWYSKINKYYEKSSTNIMYLITIFSFLSFHFRTDNVLINFYSNNDIFSYPNSMIYYISIFCVLLTLIYWILFEINNLIKKKFYINKFLLMLFFISVQLWCFLYGSNMVEVILPQLVYHAVSYQASIVKSVQNIARNQNILFKKSFIIIIISLIIGLGANQLENFLNTNPNGNLTSSILLAIYMIPTLCHHLWDAVIWKKSHPDWNEVFNVGNKNELDK